MANPTLIEALKLSAAHDYFNSILFDNSLNRCRISIASNGNAKWRGRFTSNKVKCAEDNFDEILLDTDYTAKCVEEKNLKLLFSTLVHEMCHQKLPENGHDKDWRDLMNSLGLEPVQVKPGRWREATHEIIPGGVFEKAYEQIPETIIRDWLSFTVEVKKKAAPFSKTVRCPICGCQALIKSPKTRVRCFDHSVEMV